MQQQWSKTQGDYFCLSILIHFDPLLLLPNQINFMENNMLNENSEQDFNITKVT
jgi:hypothetical protein